jgi:hypothetical protein
MIASLTVEVCGQRTVISNIEPAGARAVSFNIYNDSHYDVSVVFSSGKRMTNALGYVTPGLTASDQVVVRENSITIR